MPLSANLLKLESSFPTASEASYKLKQRSYRKTNLKKKDLVPNGPDTEMSSAEMSCTETAPSNRRRRNVPDPQLRDSIKVCSTILQRRVSETLKFGQ